MRPYHKQTKGQFKNQLKQIASKVKDDNFSFRSGSKRGSGTQRRIQMSLYRHKRKSKNNLVGVIQKKIRKYSDNQYISEKPLNSYSPKKYAGNLSASSIDSSDSDAYENGKVKLQKNFNNVVIREEENESKKDSKKETNTESESVFNKKALKHGSSSLRSRMMSDSSDLTSTLREKGPLSITRTRKSAVVDDTENNLHTKQRDSRTNQKVIEDSKEHADDSILDKTNSIKKSNHDDSDNEDEDDDENQNADDEFDSKENVPEISS